MNCRRSHFGIGVVSAGGSSLRAAALAALGFFSATDTCEGEQFILAMQGFAIQPLEMSKHRGPSAETTNAARGPQRLTAEGVLRLRAMLNVAEFANLPETDSEKYALEIREFYDSFDFSLPWIEGGKPTAQARQIIEELSRANAKGLRPEDYDGSLWSSRLAALELAVSASEGDLVQFDVALTVSTMRFLSDLHMGRVNPQALRFEFPAEQKSLDLSEFLRQKLVTQRDMHVAVESVEPQFLAYRRTLEALRVYLELARQDDGEDVPIPSQAIKPGDAYSGIPRLARILRLLGDLGVEGSTPSTYVGVLVDAVKRFQQRHGLAPNGLVDSRTLEQLNTPVARRVVQLQLTLERWRWLPQNFSRPPIVVNIPEFRLYAVNEEHLVVFSMNIIVGRAYHHETPVFESEIKSVIFRPYWNVPLAIQRNELVPQWEKNPLYLSENAYEIVDAHGNLIEVAGVSGKVKEELLTGQLLLRQKPGPKNSLGLIKFDLPNPYDVYLHGTPAQELFAKGRRDFSHGCMRVENPAALAAWVLRGNPGWTEERIRSAMNGDQTFRVRLETPIPAWVLYGTATVSEDGQVHFFKDIYGNDAALERALEQRNLRSARGEKYSRIYLLVVTKRSGARVHVQRKRTAEKS